MMDDLQGYAVRLYQHEGVEPLLLALQDEVGLDVLLLLSACWLGARGVAPAAVDWVALAGRCQPWRQELIEPLRQLRRLLKGESGTELLRAQVKACELEAEWLQLRRLASSLESLPGVDSPCWLAQLHACCQAQGSQPDRARLWRLAELCRELSD
ncbi:TIGR02444 family protein [Pseudomonas jilinensis]|uniref:TIGR02444 family protein n=1 Tax=Pseudomonas jilinensis TaxID=2078689 RepID=A0A396S122_9PSED|nr:TIGR02444 family protein [Pseudomonas jilinensis]RHW21362.1 TIGR02444 family protein [Pseudomonas jilinensis]